jgi:hypothetical protein
VSTNKEHIIEIYKVEAEKYNKTRDIQWKMNVAFWTVLIVGIYAKSKNDLNLCAINHVQQILIGTIYIFIHGVFVYQIQGSLRRSITRLRNSANEVLDNKEENNITIDDLQAKLSWTRAEQIRNISWHVFQISITGFLVLLFENI